MSITTTIDPPALKKRGRPKKVVAEDAGTVATPQQPAGVKMASTKAARGKEKAIKEKKAPARIIKNVAAKKDAPKPVAPPRTSPPSPVAAKSTPVETARSIGTQKAKATISNESAIPNPPATTAHQPSPAAPGSSKILSQVRATGTMNLPPATPPPSKTPSSPPSPSNFPPSSKSPHRTTTIPLPPSPRLAPSPKQPSASIMPSHQASPARPQRIIEPMIDNRLPAKYKPAARRITAIMVALPVVFVLGWELYGRWQGGMVRKKWPGEEGRVEG